MTSASSAVARLALAAVLATVALSAQPVDLDVLKLRENVYVVESGGANVTLQFGSDGAVVVDAGPLDTADAVIAALKAITPKPIRYVIDTSDDADHVGANEKVAKAGRTLFQTNNQFGDGMTNGGAAAILAAEKVLTRMSAPTGKTAAYPTPAWPTETYDQKRKYMYLNGEGIEVLHLPAAHTDGDSVVFFRRSDVVAAGDILDLTHFPVINKSRGGTINGEIDALNRLIELAIPSVPLVSQEGGTLVVPGHGYVCDQLDVVEYRDMVTIIRDRVQDLKKKGRTIEQVQQASPAFGYTARYGQDSGPFATRIFIEAIYETLK